MFEFDPAKSAANKQKHGIDFVEAQALWDGDLLELGVVLYDREERRLLVGSIDGKCWTTIVTQRGDNIRLISVRRARSSEEMAFERGRVR
jgi:uncharacterized protein